MDVRRRRVTGWLLVGGALVMLGGVIFAGVTWSANELSYDVLVTEVSGNGKMADCHPTVLFIDQTTGTELPCAGTPEEGYTAAERQEVLAESAKLAADGGLDGSDAFTLTQLAATIGHRHSEETSKVLPIFFLVIAVLGGATLIVGIVRKVGQLRESRAHWREWQQRLGR